MNSQSPDGAKQHSLLLDCVGGQGSAARALGAGKMTQTSPQIHGQHARIAATRSREESFSGRFMACDAGASRGGRRFVGGSRGRHYRTLRNIV
ncbi:MAG: hypothetical protein WDZ48_00085 [Pirellulales bacterium]